MSSFPGQETKILQASSSMPPKKGEKKKKKKPVYHLNFYLAVNMTQLLLNYGYEKVQQGELSQDE